MRSDAVGACSPVDSTDDPGEVGTLFAAGNWLLSSGAEEGCKPAGPSFWRAGDASSGALAELVGATKSSVAGGPGLAPEPGFGRGSSGVNFFGVPALSVGNSVGGFRCGRIGSGLGPPMSSAPGLGNTCCCCHGVSSLVPRAGSDTESSRADGGRTVGGQDAAPGGTVSVDAVSGGIAHHGSIGRTTSSSAPASPAAKTKTKRLRKSAASTAKLFSLSGRIHMGALL